MPFLHSIPSATFQFQAVRKFVPFQSKVTRKYDSHFLQQDVLENVASQDLIVVDHIGCH